MEDLKNSEQECSICFTNIIKGVKTECNHLFHDKCLNDWISINNTCPLCRNYNPIKNNISEKEKEAELLLIARVINDLFRYSGSRILRYSA